MWFHILLTTLIVVVTSRTHVDAYVEALAANIDTGLSHFQPMVAILCGHGKVHNQYLDENKRWISDPDPKAMCTKDKLEILEYCRKVYPKKDVRNIVESSRYYKINNWCKLGQKKCKAKHWVKSLRCLEGPFQSDALLVPEHCLFDHIHNSSICQSSDHWNKTGTESCDKRNMKLQSFAMLLPCGVGIFSGVEFVCCPSSATISSNNVHKIPHPNLSSAFDKQNMIDDSKRKEKETKNVKDDADDDDSDEDEDDDDYYDDDYDEDDTPSSSSSTTTTSTTTTTTERPLDSYLSHFDSQREHDTFKSAQKSLEETHRDKITKVMKEWSELEEHYQEMRLKDPKGAESFKKKMTTRFQKTVEALEEEGSAERRQLISMHQQRVMTIINLRKKAAMDCYTQSLDQTPPKAKRIEKCLEKLLRALEKDRTHTLHHYRHLLNSNTRQALREKDAMLDHLDNLIRMGNQSIQMLDRAPPVADRIRKRMVAFWHNLRGISISEIISKEAEQAILERYEEEVAQKQEERERQRMLEEERKQELKDLEDEKKRVEANQKDGKLEKEFDPESMEDEHAVTSDSEELDQNNGKSGGGAILAPTATPSVVTSSHSQSLYLQHEDDENNEVDHDVLPTPKIAHIQNQVFHHNEASYSVRREPYHLKTKWNGSVYVTLAFAGIALLTATIVGVILLRKHTQRSPHSQGFVEVDQAVTPEERHVANMQINGYENPTYKFFEATTSTSNA